MGFVSRLLPFLLPYRLVKVDQETGELIRDPKTGLCVQCQPGEPGELVSPISQSNPVRAFDGYLDKKATSKKVVEGVLRKGDRCFRTGDLMEMDNFGWLYFRDRAGDTYRWKGENVSTLEVESEVSGIIGSKDVAAYGVEVCTMILNLDKG